MAIDAKIKWNRPSKIAIFSLYQERIHGTSLLFPSHRVPLLDYALSIGNGLFDPWQEIEEC